MTSRRAASLIVCVGIVYAAVGLVTAELARHASSPDAVAAWRWTAWIVSAVAFGGHIVYEQVWMHGATKITAWRVALAVGLGAFGLAASANVHALYTPAGRSPLLLALSLVIWPIMTALPAFVVAYVAATLLARATRTQP